MLKILVKEDGEVIPISDLITHADVALWDEVAQAINTGFVGRILPYWSELFLKYSATTEEVIYTLGQKKEARKNQFRRQ